MKSFRTKAIIHAAPERIWAILTDAASYPSWNPAVDRVEGRIALGEKVTVYPKSAAGRAFPVNVASFDPGKSMVWSGGMPLGLFKGVGTFRLNPRPDGSVEFSMQEEFSGLLSPLTAKSIPDLQPDFEAFAQGLKTRSEKA